MKIPIIIPVYNAARYLRECLDSVLAQSYKDWECICVDDGSTDVSGAILNEYAARESRFHVIHQKNAGAWAARNAALDVAQSEWVTFVDADDVLNPHWLQSYADLAEKTGADLVRQRYTYGKRIPEDFAGRVENDECEVYEGSSAKEWMWNTMAATGFLWCCCIRRRLVEGVRFLPARASFQCDSWMIRDSV